MADQHINLPLAFCKTCKRDVHVDRTGAFVTHGPYRDQFICPASRSDAPKKREGSNG